MVYVGIGLQVNLGALKKDAVSFPKPAASLCHVRLCRDYGHTSKNYLPHRSHSEQCGKLGKKKLYASFDW